MKKDKKIVLIIIAVIILVVIIIVAFKLLNKNEVNLSVDSNGNVTNIGNLNTDGNNAQLQNNSSTSDYTYNPDSIPQKDIEYIEQYVDDKGNELSGEDLSKIKDNIVQAFKKVSSDKLGINVDLNNVRIIFNQGTTIINKNRCLVFCVYVAENDTLRNVGMYAMTKDTKVLYKFNSDTLTYDLIEK